MRKLEQELEQVLEEGFLVRFSDLRLYTSIMLLDFGPTKWRNIMEILLPPDGEDSAPVVAPGIREAVIRSLGDVLAEDRPLNPALAEIWLGLHKVTTRGEEDLASKWAPGGIPMPTEVQRRAALAINELVGSGWREDDPDLIARAQAWWMEHRDDPAYWVPFGDTFPERYAFAVAADPVR